MTYYKSVFWTEPIDKQTNKVKSQKGNLIDETIKTCLGIFKEALYEIHLSGDKIYSADIPGAKEIGLFEKFLLNCKRKEGFITWNSINGFSVEAYITSNI